MNALSAINVGFLGTGGGAAAGLPFWNTLEPGLVLDGSANLVVASGNNHFAWSNRRIKFTGDYFEVTVDADFLSSGQMFFIQTSNSMATVTYSTSYKDGYFVSGAMFNWSPTLASGDVLRFEVTSATTVVLKRNGAVLGTLTHSQPDGFLVGIYSGGVAVGHTITKPIFVGTVGV